MELKAWIEERGGVAEAAEVLGEKPRTVASWFYGERPPAFRAALNIYEKSGRRVDFNGVYMSFARAALGDDKVDA